MQKLKSTKKSGRACYDPDLLFCIETNEGFPWNQITPTPPIIEAARAFDKAPIVDLSIVQKRNKNSEIYRVETPRENIILRSVAKGSQEFVERQCIVVNAVRYGNIVKPLRSRSGSFTVAVGEEAWMAYLELPGRLFTGAGVDVETALASAIQLQQKLVEAEMRLLFAPGELPAVSHRPEKWGSFFMELTGSESASLLPPEMLNDDTRRLLRENREFFSQCIDRCMGLHVQETRRLTHNDLQHANVLVHEGECFFLDIEDICRESQEIAISHAVFKLLRHVVFAGVSRAESLRRDTVSRIVALLQANYRIENRQDLFAYSSYRILSDIWEIVACFLEQNDESQLYDLEKRIHNLFELDYLLRE